MSVSNIGNHKQLPKLNLLSYNSNSSQNGKKIYREAAKDAKEIFFYL
jgi:hypothetical protein